MNIANHAFTWDELEWQRDQMLIEADMHCEVMDLSKRIDAIEKRELHKAVKLWRDFAKLQQQAIARSAPSWTQRAIDKAMTKCEEQILALGGELPIDP